MASESHSTQKVSAHAVYTRQRQLVDATVKKMQKMMSTMEKMPENAPAGAQTNSARKRKVGALQNGNGPIKGKRGRKKKVVQEETSGGENSHSPFLDKLTAEDTDNEDELSSFMSSSTENDTSASVSKVVACGNEAADEAFRWLLSPVKPETFFEEAWDKKPFHIQRSNKNHYQGLYSTRAFEKIVKENNLSCNVEIDIVKYVDGERIPHETDMKIHPAFLCDAYKDGYSIRMRNPQTYNKPLASLCSLLQEYFASFVGANMYLTPANSQGFPPHYDDIDAFILQIEGKKLWKLYTPSPQEELARHSSRDLSERDLEEPCMEVELKTGDLLYFPRGYIHEARAAPGTHSMHITISTNQLNTWGDFLQEGLSRALELAMEKDVEFRQTVPKDYFNYAGQVCDSDSPERKEFEKKALSLVQKAVDYFSVDFAADARAIDFIHSAMPPYFSEDEKACSVHGNGATVIHGEAVVTAKLNLKTKVRLIRKRVFRMTVDDEGCRLFYTLANGKNLKEEDVRFVEIESEYVPVVTALFKNHPEYTKIENFPHPNKQSLLRFIQELYNNGFLLTDEPLPPQK